MYFEGEYRLIGSMDASRLQTAVAALPEAAWFEDTDRQQVYAPHRQTQTIPLIFDPDMRHENPTVRPAFARFEDDIRPVTDAIRAFFIDSGTDGADRAYFVRGLLTRLGGGCTIGSHRDHGYSLARAHRIHCAVFTNEAAQFGIAGHIRHLPAGEIWEINNRKVHGVRNLGDAARVHLILDYVIPGETVQDPEDGMLVA